MKNNFIAQLTQLLSSADEDSWLTGLINLISNHTNGWVKLSGRSGKTIAEALPSSGIRPINPLHYIEKYIRAGDTILGSICIGRQSNDFTQDEEEIIEISISICTMQLRCKEKQAIIKRKQRADAVREAINALSFSELEAAIHIISALNGYEGRLIAGSIADKLGFTRSIMVTALKKLEGAGIIETRSLGVKGTYIKVREPILSEELKKLGVVKI